MLSVGTLVVLVSQMALFIEAGESSGCEDLALGMENGNIPDEALTGFPYNPKNSAKYGRVNTPTVFCTGSPPQGSHLQIDLGTLHEVCAVGTQGFDGGQNDYMTTYQVDWSSNGAKWFEYKEDGVPKIFVGNINHNDVKKNTLSGLKARYIRIRPLTWHVYPCIRVELYGRKYSLPQGGTTLFIPLGEDQALSDHVIKSTVAIDVTACMWECMLSVPQCKSYNYNHVTTSCELNSATKEESPGEFVKRVGFTHYAEQLVEVISF